jgi:hypothetical protein
MGLTTHVNAPSRLVAVLAEEQANTDDRQQLPLRSDRESTGPVRNIGWVTNEKLSALVSRKRCGQRNVSFSYKERGKELYQLPSANQAPAHIGKIVRVRFSLSRIIVYVT